MNRAHLCLLLFVALATACASPQPAAKQEVRAVKVSIPTATPLEVSDQIVLRMKQGGWTIEESTPELVIIFLIRPFNQPQLPTLTAILCKDQAPCLLGHRVTYALSHADSDVAVSATSQLITQPGTKDEKSSDFTRTNANEILGGLSLVQTYFRARANPSSVPLGQKLDALAVGATRTEIIHFAGPPASETAMDDGQVLLTFEEEVVSAPSNAVGQVKGDQCMVTLKQDLLVTSMCLSAVIP